MRFVIKRVHFLSVCVHLTDNVTEMHGDNRVIMHLNCGLD